MSGQESPRLEEIDYEPPLLRRGPPDIGQEGLYPPQLERGALDPQHRMRRMQHWLLEVAEVPPQQRIDLPEIMGGEFDQDQENEPFRNPLPLRVRIPLGERVGPPQVERRDVQFPHLRREQLEREERALAVRRTSPQERVTDISHKDPILIPARSPLADHLSPFMNMPTDAPGFIQRAAQCHLALLHRQDQFAIAQKSDWIEMYMQIDHLSRDEAIQRIIRTLPEEKRPNQAKAFVENLLDFDAEAYTSFIHGVVRAFVLSDLSVDITHSITEGGVDTQSIFSNERNPLMNCQRAFLTLPNEQKMILVLDEVSEAMEIPSYYDLFDIKLEMIRIRGSLLQGNPALIRALNVNREVLLYLQIP